MGVLEQKVEKKTIDFKDWGGRSSQRRWHTIRGPGAAHRVDGKRAIGDKCETEISNHCYVLTHFLTLTAFPPRKISTKLKATNFLLLLMGKKKKS